MCLFTFCFTTCNITCLKNQANHRVVFEFLLELLRKCPFSASYLFQPKGLKFQEYWLKIWWRPQKILNIQRHPYWPNSVKVISWQLSKNIESKTDCQWEFLMCAFADATFSKSETKVCTLFKKNDSEKSSHKLSNLHRIKMMGKVLSIYAYALCIVLTVMLYTIPSLILMGTHLFYRLFESKPYFWCVCVFVWCGLAFRCAIRGVVVLRRRKFPRYSISWDCW